MTTNYQNDPNRSNSSKTDQMKPIKMTKNWSKMIKITKTDHMNRSDQDDQKWPKRNQLKHQKMNKITKNDQSEKKTHLLVR